MVDGGSIPEPLTDAAPDAARGAEVYADPLRGGCVACHAIDGQGGAAGPSLDGVGGRLSESVLRLWIVNPGILRDDPGMPAYYSVAPETPGGPLRDAPRLSAEEVEDLIAYLETLTSSRLVE